MTQVGDVSHTTACVRSLLALVLRSARQASFSAVQLLLLGGGVATAEWPLPRAPAPPLVLALDTWPLPPPEAGEAGSHRGTWHPSVTARRAVAGATDRHGSLLLEVRSPLGRLAHSYLPKTSQNLLTIA